VHLGRGDRPLFAAHATVALRWRRAGVVHNLRGAAR
jgi:hypothetical protein